MDDDDAISLDYWFTWAGAALFLVPAVAIALYGRHASGGWTHPWLTLKPVWWFLLLFLVPPLGYLSRPSAGQLRAEVT